MGQQPIKFVFALYARGLNTRAGLCPACSWPGQGISRSLCCPRVDSCPRVKPVTTKSQRSAADAKGADGAKHQDSENAAILRFYWFNTANTLWWLNLNLTEYRHTNVTKQSISFACGLYWAKAA